LVLQGQFGAQDLVALRVLQTDTGIVVPARAELIGESPVNFVAKRDLKPLDGPYSDSLSAVFHM
jgi:hypothetical protein